LVVSLQRNSIAPLIVEDYCSALVDYALFNSFREREIALFVFFFTPARWQLIAEPQRNQKNQQ